VRSENSGADKAEDRRECADRNEHAPVRLQLLQDRTHAAATLARSSLWIRCTGNALHGTARNAIIPRAPMQPISAGCDGLLHSSL